MELEKAENMLEIMKQERKNLEEMEQPQERFLEKWGRGIRMITPLQMARINLMGSSLVLIGVVIGLITTFLSEIWWLFIILVGSLFLTGTSFLGLIQKYIAIKERLG